jgi:spoIIIJ-associated protein
MEWVETTGRTVEEAKERALDQLSVGEDDAEFEVLDEPRAGLFGRVRGEARVRARVRPTQPRPKGERNRDRRPRRGDGEAKPAGDGEAGTPAPGRDPARHQRTAPRRDRPREHTAGDRPTREEAVSADQVGDEAQKFVQGLVDAFGLSGSASVRVEGDEVEVAVAGNDLGLLVGPRGTTLQAVQEIARVAAQRRLGDHDTRLRVDVGGYRERRKEALTRFAEQVAKEVVESGTARRLEPMNSADRKVIHDVLAEFGGVATRSEGEDPQRRVVIAPADG